MKRSHVIRFGEVAVKVDDSFKALLRPLSGHERAHLKDAIRVDGRCISQLVAAQIEREPGLPILIDGHHRSELIAELRAEGISVEEPSILVKRFPSRFEAIDYVARLQGGRRNWEAQDRIRFILEKTDFVQRLKAEALKRKRSGKRQVGTEKLRGRVAYQVAAMTDTSPTTVKQVSRVLESGNQALIERLFHSDAKQRIAIGEAAVLVGSASKARFIQARLERLRSQPMPSLPRGSFLDKIVCADSLDALRKLPDGCVQLTVTSPPYAVHGIDYDNAEYDSDYPAYLAWLGSVFAELHRVTEPNGRIVLNIDASNERDIEKQERNGIVHNVFADVSQQMSAAGWLFRGDHIFYKQSSVGTRPSWGSYARCSNPRIRRNHEYLLVFQKGNGSLRGDEAMCDLTQDEFEQFTLSHWYVKPQRALPPSHPDFHPVPFPQEIVYRCVKLYSYRHATILDPFVGSGTTAFVARALNRRYIGIDKSPLYCASARRIVKALDGLTNRQKEAAIRRFTVSEGERADGYGRMQTVNIKARQRTRARRSRLDQTPACAST